MKRAAWPVIACALLFLAASVLPVPAQAASDPVNAAAAKRDGAVVWYTSTPVELAQRIAEMFERETGIKVQLFRTGGSALLRRFMQEESAGRIFADVLTMSDQAAARALADKGLFVPFKPEGFDKVIADGKDPTGRFIAQRMTLIGMLVRADKVPQADWPKTWTDLRSPKYKGMMVMTNPSFTAIQLMIVGTLSRLHGWGFYEDLRRNDTMIVQGHEQAFDTIQRGERVVAAEGTNPRVYTRGRPVENIVALYPATEAILVPSPTAVVKAGPHPDAAKLFAQFQISLEVQRLFPPYGLHSSRVDVEPPAGAPALGAIKPLPLDYDYLEKHAAEIKQRFAEIFQ